ncbi:MAG TPA: class I SAM-dependent methyltransferase [Rhizomicrobium sp.]|nr:class I SAM-dependent methyltransferase [Rhizomicrobium sp.]
MVDGLRSELVDSGVLGEPGAIHVGWNHNTHYHPLLLSRIPPGSRTALDAGCGYGEFAALLAAKGLTVDAVDSDPQAIANARASHAGEKGLGFRQCSFVAGDCIRETYDVVTCIAALHHVDFAQGIAALQRAVSPGGTLLILGLYREASAMDFAAAALAAPVNLALALRHGRAGTPDPMLTKVPPLSLAEVRTQAAILLPAATIRRLLLWRYLLEWRRPRV